MKKDKIYTLGSIALMVIGLVLVIWDFTEGSIYKLQNVVSHFGLFFVGVYFFYLHRRNRREKEGGAQKDKGDGKPG